MNTENPLANKNFIVNGDFSNDLDGWEINDERKVTRQTGQWQNKEVSYINAVNMGEGEQTIMLALLPRPTPDRAVYKLMFHYEAVQGAIGTLRINPGLGGEVDLRLAPSLEAESEPLAGLDDLLLDLDLKEYSHELTLATEEESVKFTIISPDNGGPGRPGAVRVTFVRVELLLEPLRLDCVMIDGERQPPGERLHLCFGARHELALQLSSDSMWSGTLAGMLVNDDVSDPENILDSSPPWGAEHPVADPWEISCRDVFEDREIEHILAVRSQYTADTYSLSTVSGHFRLDVIALLEAVYYPVIDLNQRVLLRVRVLSHYTRMPLASREVTWTLKGPTDADDIVLFRQPTDENGEAEFTWTPSAAGNWQIEASVNSHYKKEDARYRFAVRVLKEDPWLSATFSLDGSQRQWIWGQDTGYPCRGATHEVRLSFAPEHVLSESELALHWEGDDPAGLDMAFNPDLDAFNPVEGAGQKWAMVCGNRRDSRFGFTVSCSKLLHPSPSQALVLAHNWLALGETRQPTRFPSVGGADLRLEAQILSQVPGVGGVSGIDVEWHINGSLVETLRTGDDGWSVYPFRLVEEGVSTIAAKAVSLFDGLEIEFEFRITVLPENPWNQLVTVTLNGRKEERVGLLCFRNAEPVDLLVVPGDDTLLDEEIFLELRNADDLDLDFHFDPPLNTRRQLTKTGLVWKVHSNSNVSALFQLYVCHEELTPFELQGRLLSKRLEEEGTLRFDDKVVDSSGTLYPCLGGEHTLHFTPAIGSLLNGLEVAAIVSDVSGRAPDMKLEPEQARELQSEGLGWTLDARNATEAGESVLSLELPQAGFTYPPIDLSLGHNRIKIADVRGPTFDPFVGETVNLEINIQSYYTERALAGIWLGFSHGGATTPVLTSADGWARFRFTATQTGSVQVIATAPSLYDEPGNSPSFTFEFIVLAVVEKSDSTRLMPPVEPAGEGAPALEEQLPANIEIDEVREASFDPMVGESVWLAIKVRSLGSRRSMAGIDVTFTVGQSSVRVKTQDDGWARFAFPATQVGTVEVVATLESANARQGSAPFHTFRFQALAANVWDDARIQLATDSPKTVWGAETCFPRMQTYTIRLWVDNPDSHLLGRAITLGLKGYSSARDLGLTSVQPALGVPRTLTANGLSWQFTGTKGGAHFLQLEAYRLLKLSPLNAMSLGPIPAPTAELAGD
ncbi:hypothetical protein ACXR0M_13775 [Pseudomonas sp. Eth.TT006]